MAVFSYNSTPGLTNLSSNFEERNVHSYNEDSAIYIVDEDFGSITAGIDAEEDYGSILDNPLGWETINYGFITINETLVPYGPINIGDNDFADLKLVKVGIGDVTFSILGEAKIFTIPIEKGSGTFTITGTSGDPRFTLAHFGSGSLFSLSSSTEVISSIPPTSTVLFRFAGSAVEKNTESYVGSGSLFTFISKTETSTSAESAQGLFRISGTVAESIVPAPHIGSGRIFGFTGSSEAVTDVPPVSTVLYRFAGVADDNFIRNYAGISEGEFFTHGSADTLFSLKHIGSGNFKVQGSVSESITPAPHIGSGEIFAFTGSSESVTRDPQDLTTLFEISGDANYKLSSSHVGEVDLNIEGKATTLFGLGHIGSGKFFTFISATEAVGFVGEVKVLYRFAGSAVEKNTEAYNGSGSLFGFSSATESTSNAESAKGLFKLSGVSRNIFVINNIGSGSLFGFSSATESITVNPPEETALFRFAGSAVEKNTEVYAGSGALFGFSSTTESVGANPPEFAPVLKLAGTAAEAFVPAPHIAAGSLFAFGSATETRSVSPQASGIFTFTGTAPERKTNAYAGSGALFGFSSTTESIAIALSISASTIKIRGRGAEAFVPAPHIGTGSFRTFSGAAETRSVSPKTSVLFEFIGNVTESSTRSQVGSGSLFGITGSYEAIEVVPKIAGILFTLFGDVRERFVPSGEKGSGMVLLRGVSINRKVVFVPAKPTRILLI